MRAFLLLLTLLLGACAVQQPPVPMRRFAAGDVAAVKKFFQEQVEQGDEENLALVLNGLAQTELLLGDGEAAWRHFQTAGRIMGNWQTSGGEVYGALLGSESSKTWKGDPYEKAMNAFYTGLLFLWRGEPDNARAAFKKGILADGESADEKYQADFTLLFWLAGRMSQLMGLSGDARDFFAEARKADEFSRKNGSRGSVPNALLDDPGRGNLVCLVEVGLGPEKYASGSQNELARFRPRWHPAHGARLFLDGRELPPPAVLADVDYQARTRGGTEMDGIRGGKAVFKTAAAVGGVVALSQSVDRRGRINEGAAIVGGSLLLLSALTSTEADVRHWPTLPSTVQVLAVDAAPGSHRLRIEFTDDRGRPLADLTQEWTVDVPDQGESYYLFRSLPGLDRLQRIP